MSELPPPVSRSEREARRALLQDALTELATTDHPEAASEDVLRALDGYLDSAPPGSQGAPREPAVADFSDRRDVSDARTITWLVVGAAVVATAVVAILLSGGWPAAIAVAAIWLAALVALLTS